MATITRLNKQILKTVVQGGVTATALYLVLRKTDVARLIELARHADPWYLLASVVFFNISKIANAFRLNRFFRIAGLNLSTWYNLKLYYLGMFYNQFLPGGIGGDGYKIYVLKKNHGVTVLNIFNAVVWDRICGIFALVFLSVVLLMGSSFAQLYPRLLPAAGLVVLLNYPLSWLLTRLFQKPFLRIYVPTLLDSLIVQITQLVSAWLILRALSIPGHDIDYLAIFLVSTVATILPITIGGAGAREVTFYYALNLLGLEASPGVALSLIFFTIAAVSSLAGILSRIRHEKTHDAGNEQTEKRREMRVTGFPDP